jgi:AraC family transcriptional activator of pobA
MLLNIVLHIHKLQLAKSGKVYDTEEPFAKSKVVEFIQLLNAHFKEEHAIEFYADKMNVPSKALTLICQKGIGWAPKAIIQSKLLTEAKRLLLFDAGSAQDVSMELGFNDHAGFIIFFKKYMGISPKDYRTEHSIKGQKGENSVA